MSILCRILQSLKYTYQTILCVFGIQVDTAEQVSFYAFCSENNITSWSFTPATNVETRQNGEFYRLSGTCFSCLAFFILSVFDECHLPAEAVDDEGEVDEEVVADHAFEWDVCLFCVLLALSGLVNSGW